MVGAQARRWARHRAPVARALRVEGKAGRNQARWARRASCTHLKILRPPRRRLHMSRRTRYMAPRAEDREKPREQAWLDRGGGGGHKLTQAQLHLIG